MKFEERSAKAIEPSTTGNLDSAWLKQLALDHGADDAGLVRIGHPALDDQRVDILKFYPKTKALLAIVCRMNREPIRNPSRSVANLEFHSTGDQVDDVCREVVAALERRGVPAINPPMGFPMEADRWPEKMWVVSHKPVAVAAGMGMMGIHRNVIHPKFGNFILLGTVLVGADSSEYDRPIDYNPCMSCKLCVAACPVGAISPDGRFDLASCFTHNYREFMGGFGDWTEHVAEAKDGMDLRKKVSRQETVSVWQSLAFGPNYKAAYCLSVCPAGEDVIGPFQADKKGFINEIVRPLQEKEETIYVVPKSDAEDHVKKRFPHKKVKHVRGSLLPRTIAGFLSGMPHTFQRGQSAGLNAVFHFTFTGTEPLKSTVVIRDQAIRVAEGHEGTSDLHLFADGEAWLGFLAKERSLLWALLRRKIQIKGPPRLLIAFGKCFPQ